MIYCNVQDVEFEPTNEPSSRFKCPRFFNADNEDVTEIFPSDPITILPLIPSGDPTLLIVEKFENGWVYPVTTKFNLDLDDLPKGIAVYKGQGE